MKKRYPVLLSALVMLVSCVSCGSEDISSQLAPSAADSTVSTVSTNGSVSALTTEKATGKAIEKAAEKDPDELPVMDAEYKVLSCLDVEGTPMYISSCGNTVVVQCYTENDNNTSTMKYYIADAVKDRLLGTVDVCNEREILLGNDANGNITAELWKDVVNGTDETDQIVYYKPDGTRSAEEYTGDMMFLKYGYPGQLYDLSKGIAKIGYDGSRESCFDKVGVEETRFLDISRNRAVVSYSAESFTEPTTLMLIDTSTGKEITELKAVNVYGVYGAGDYVVVSFVPDLDTNYQYISVYEKETGSLVWTCCEKDDKRSDCFTIDDSCYDLTYSESRNIKPLTYHFLRDSDGATGTLKPDIPNAFREVSTSVT